MKKTHPLRSYRALHGLSCADLAKTLGIAESTLRSYENGNRIISAETAVDFEKRLGAKVARRELCPHIFGSELSERAA